MLNSAEADGIITRFTLGKVQEENGTRTCSFEKNDQVVKGINIFWERWGIIIGEEH